MAIELWIDNTGAGTIIVACVHCGGDVMDLSEGIAIWEPSGDPNPLEGTVFCIEYAHRDCEEHYLEGLRGAEVNAVRKINMPLADLFDALRQPLAARHDDPNGGKA
jgi:hypothetical protein